MKILKFAAIIITGFMLSCSRSNSTDVSLEGFQKLEENLNDQFGKEAYYTELSITPIETLGNIVTTTVTKDPSSLKMGQWNNTQGDWNLTSDVALSIEGNAKASDFMFQLDEKINLKTLGKLVEQSMKKLITSHNLKNPKLDIAYINFPKDGNLKKMQYVLKLRPEHGGTAFDFFYDIKGNSIK